jgi:hypothetical protein
MAECGMALDFVNLEDDITNIRFLMRDTAPVEESIESNKRFIDGFIER